MIARHAALAMLAVALPAVAGCRAGGLTSNTRPDPVAARPPDLAPTKVIAQINKNARAVQSLRASPSIKVSVDDRDHYGVNGKLAMERPRNFHLTLDSTMRREADIGSNDQGFWFWVGRSKEKEVYVCRYDESGASPLAAAYQPDWIVEALGLREIPEEEAADMTVDRANGPGGSTLTLTQHRKATDGSSYTKKITVDAASGLVLEHSLYDGNRKELLARAIILPGRNGSRYQKVEVPGVDGEAPSTVYVPSKVQLEWRRERLKLDVEMGRPQINPELDARIFAEPPFPGYARRDIGAEAGIAGARDSGSSSAPKSVRQTRPVPPTGVRLDEPEPLDADASAAATPAPRNRLRNRAAARNEYGEVPLTNNDARVLGVADVVGARWPAAPVPDFQKPDSPAWARAPERSYEP